MKTIRKETIIYDKHSEIVLSYQKSPVVFQEHWHLAAEFIMADNDNCKYTINGEEYTLKKGEVLLSWPTEVHSVVHTPPKASLILQFSSDAITGCADIDMVYQKLRSIHLITSEHEELRQKLCDLMFEMNTIFNTSEPFVFTRLKIRLLQILLLLAEEFCFQKGEAETDQPDVSVSDTYLKIKAACTYITAHCDHAISQAEVADYIGFSQYYFSRIFKKYVSESFSEFLTRQRIQKAIRLLSTEHISVTEVGFIAGFQSLSSFNKAFKSHMGCSPSEFRKLHVRNGLSPLDF